ncbi:DUF6488 family protein, partial [Halomonas campaniensis]|uniref:DUF6488 family protein n=1 Tax=Halomonas campaniensis TaxID=213554 RepID=UPI0039708107
MKFVGIPQAPSPFPIAVPDTKCDGPGGGHGPVSPEKATAIALDAARQFSDFDPGLGFGKLEGSWKTLTKEAAKIKIKGDGYYIASVANKAEGKILYVLMSASGSVYDANFTGELPKVK